MRKSIPPLMMTVSLGAFWSLPALAYIGPGAGITILGALWGVVVAILLAIGAVLFWPLRVLMRRRRNRVAGAASRQTADPSRTHPGERSENDRESVSPGGTPASAK